MKGWQQLKSYEQLDLYYKWRRDNREIITEELRTAYIRFCEHPNSAIKRGADFGAFVGVPLLVLWLCWAYVLSSTRDQLIAGAICVAFGFLLRYYQKHIMDLMCRYFFRDTTRKILESYVDCCRAADMEQSASKEDEADIDGFYEYCRRQILSEDFRYYEKDYFRMKRKKK